MALLTKSKYLAGLSCPKCLWTAVNDREKMPEADAALQNRFDEGHKVGELAKKLYPNGIDIPSDDFMGNIRAAKQLLGEKKVLFEPGFMKDKLFARVDILKPVKGNRWDIIEVKSSTSVKEVNLHDVSFQKHCLEKSGLIINKCSLAFINNKFVKEGEVYPEAFFTVEDITERVEVAGKGIKGRIAEMFKIISSKECPELSIGKHCDAPYSCNLKEHCWNFLPETHVFQIYRGEKKSTELFESGVSCLSDIPDGFKLNVKQEIQKECEKTKKPHINKKAIQEFLASLKYPLYYLDFETFNTAIPLFDGTKPYQNIPFQFSLHVVDEKGGGVKHHSFLAEGATDPRPKFAEKLKEVIGTKGSIIVYYQAFEIGRLKELMASFPENKEWVDNALGRIVDLFIPFGNFDYYSPLQKGSASIKKVLPALTGKG